MSGDHVAAQRCAITACSDLTKPLSPDELAALYAEENCRTFHNTVARIRYGGRAEGAGAANLNRYCKHAISTVQTTGSSARWVGAVVYDINNSLYRIVYRSRRESRRQSPISDAAGPNVIGKRPFATDASVFTISVSVSLPCVCSHAAVAVSAAGVRLPVAFNNSWFALGDCRYRSWLGKVVLL